MKQNSKIKLIFIVLIFLVSLPFILYLIPEILQVPLRVPSNSPIFVTHKLYDAYNEIKNYSEENNKYPSAEIWCDLILPYMSEDIKRIFTSTKKINTNIALNPNAKPDSPDNVVLLFECIGPSWNAYGQSELLVQKTRNGKHGCHVVFNDGQIEFIKPDQVKNLNWGNNEN